MLEKLIPNHNVRIPLYFVMFFITLAILDSFFVYIALSTHNGVVTENAYEKGLNYNRTIEQAETAKKLNQKNYFSEFRKLKSGN